MRPTSDIYWLSVAVGRNMLGLIEGGKNFIIFICIHMQICLSSSILMSYVERVF